MFVSELVAFGRANTGAQASTGATIPLRETPLRANNILKGIDHLQEIRGILSHLERRQYIEKMTNGEIIHLSATIYHEIRLRNTITPKEKDILLALGQVAHMRSLEEIGESSFTVGKQDSVSRYSDERKRVEYINGGFTRITLLREKK